MIGAGEQRQRNAVKMEYTHNEKGDKRVVKEDGKL